MVQKAKKSSSFRGKVASNAQRTSKGSNVISYLRLPKGIPFLNPEPEGTLKLDFMPYIVTDSKHPDRDAEQGTAVKGSIWWRRPFAVHRNVGVDQETVICLKSFGMKCPICEFRAKRKAAGASNEELKGYNASSRNLYLVIPKASKKFEEKLHVFDISDFLFQELLTKELKEDPDKEIFPDLEEGWTLKVRFEPGSFATSKPYPEANRIDFIERDEQYDPDSVNDMPSLDDMLIKKTYEELETMLLEGTSNSEKDEDEEQELEEVEYDEEETPKRLKKSPKRVVEDEEEQEEDEENEAPIPKKKLKKQVIEEDEEEQEDEEEEKPVRKSVSRKPSKRVVEEDEEEEEETVPHKKPVAKTTGKNKCPHGLKFGVDTEKYDVCDTCDVWSDCVAAHEKN